MSSDILQCLQFSLLCPFLFPTFTPVRHWKEGSLLYDRSGGCYTFTCIVTFKYLKCFQNTQKNCGEDGYLLQLK